jgi:hypothetical protein
MHCKIEKSERKTPPDNRKLRETGWLPSDALFPQKSKRRQRNCEHRSLFKSITITFPFNLFYRSVKKLTRYVTDVD